MRRFSNDIKEWLSVVAIIALVLIIPVTFFALGAAYAPMRTVTTTHTVAAVTTYIYPNGTAFYMNPPSYCQSGVVYLSNWKTAFKQEHGKSYEAFYVQTRLRKLKEELGACQWPGCGATDPDVLELCHIKKTRLAGLPRGARGRSTKFWDVLNNAGSYTFFCDHSAPDHHQQFDDAREAGVKLGWKPKSLLELARERGYPSLKVLLTQSVESSV